MRLDSGVASDAPMGLSRAGPLVVLLDPVVLLRGFYLAAAALILLIRAVPALRDRFLAYGSRSSRPLPPKSGSATIFSRLLDHLTTYRVPHRYFAHFYVLSTLSSLFWGYQIWTRGQVFQAVAACVPNGASSMTLAQIYMTWALMLLQGIRRLLECLASSSSSTSTMWIGHYILGHLFYLTINISIWVEGVQALESGSPSSPAQPLLSRLPQALILPVLLLAHVGQHSYHAYLSSLRTANKTYGLPSHPFFPHTLCPHYALEVMIYCCLALLAAPEGRISNWTVAAGVVFVAVNLGVTAQGTKEWYVEKFGKDKVATKWRMVPWVW